MGVRARRTTESTNQVMSRSFGPKWQMLPTWGRRQHPSCEPIPVGEVDVQTGQSNKRPSSTREMNHRCALLSS